jgi:hypothetical protein
MLVGCKKDLVEANFISIDAKVNTLLKCVGDRDLDVSQALDYICCG